MKGLIKAQRNQGSTGGGGTGATGGMVSADSQFISADLDLGFAGVGNNIQGGDGDDNKDGDDLTGAAGTKGTGATGTKTDSTGNTGGTDTTGDAGDAGGTDNDDDNNDGDGDGDDTETLFIEDLINTSGEEFTEEELAAFTNDTEGVLAFNKAVSLRLAQREVEKDFQEFVTNNPEVPQMLQAKKNGMLREWYAAQANGGVLPETTLAETDTNSHFKVIVDNFISTGMPKESAEQMAKYMVDNGTSYATAKAIADKKTADFKADQDKLAADRKAAEARQEEARIASVNKQVEAIKKGKIGDIVIPMNRREEFIKAYLEPAGDPTNPNLSKVGLKIANMTEEEKVKFAYLVHCDFNVEDVVKATIKRQGAQSLKGSKATASGKSAGSATPSTNKTYDFNTPVVNA